MKRLDFLRLKIHSYVGRTATRGIPAARGIPATRGITAAREIPTASGIPAASGITEARGMPHKIAVFLGTLFVIAAYLGVLCLTAVFLGGCGQDADSNAIAFKNDVTATGNGGDANAVICREDVYSAYPEAVSRMLPSYAVTAEKKTVYEALEIGATTEAFDTQAIPSITAGVAGYWYPQYLATVVIAVDRDRTGVSITGWGDLPGALQKVGVSTAEVDLEMLTAAVAYGLEGEEFTLRGVMDMLASLHKAGLLIRNSFEPPILICYDYQAAALIKSGRNIEIVVPAEGTLSYEKGLLSKTELPLAELSNTELPLTELSRTKMPLAELSKTELPLTELSFSGDTDSLLQDAGFRLIDGRCDGALYPATEVYASAARVTDFEHLNAVTQDSLRLLRRNVLQSRTYSSTDGREHQFFALLYMIVVFAWTASFMHRAMQKGARRGMFFTGVILIGWIMARLVKYQIPPETTLSRYLWFSYYLFQLSLPLVILRIAWVIDKKEIIPPKWMISLAAAYGTLFAIVMTNDLHNLVFRVDLANPNWSSEYDYGFMYYIVMSASFIPLILAMGMMIYKGFLTRQSEGLLTRPREGLTTRQRERLTTRPKEGVTTRPREGLLMRPREGLLTRPREGLLTHLREGLTTRPRKGVTTRTRKGLLTCCVGGDGDNHRTHFMGGHSLRTKRIAFPLVLFVLLTAYAIGYAARFPLAWESDFTMTVGLFALLMIETMIRAGLIPTNVKYTALFRGSSLGMQIIDRAGHTVWSSAPSTSSASSAVSASSASSAPPSASSAPPSTSSTPNIEPYPEETLKQALASSPLPTQMDQNTLVFASDITGGHVLWQEDISDLNRLHREMQDANSKLEAANAVLAEEERLKRVIAEESNRTALTTQLEAEIAEHTIKLSDMIEKLEGMEDRKKGAARITLQLCYIKRRCSLFFRERETAAQPPDELASYLDEIADIADYCDVKVIVTNVLKCDVSVRRATVLYDFFYSIIYWATWLEDMKILAHIEEDDGNVVLRLLTSENASSYRMEKELERDIEAADGTYIVKVLDDDAVGLSLSFKAGGDVYD